MKENPFKKKTSIISNYLDIDWKKIKKTEFTVFYETLGLKNSVKRKRSKEKPVIKNKKIIIVLLVNKYCVSLTQKKKENKKNPTVNKCL